MSTDSFNPAFYVSFTADGEKFLPLAAKMLWFKHEYPGYRIVSDGMDVFTHEVLTESGEKMPKTILLGHVAVLDAEGMRVISVPCSVSVNSSGGDCAVEFFEVGADLALDSMGMTVYNITSGQWSEYWKVKNGWEEERDGSSGGSVIGRLFGKSAPERESPQEANKKSFAARTPETIQKMPAIEAMDEVEGEASEDNVLSIFRDVLVYCPNEVPSYRPGTNVDEEMLSRLFDRFCLALTGAQWDVADDIEKGQILEKMKALLHDK